VNDAKYIGLDVHQATISATVLDSTGKLLMESILETKAATILQFIHGLRGSLHVTFEEGTCAAWLHDLLKPHVRRVLVCDPRKNALLKIGNKSDRIDSRKLAELLHSNLLRHHPRSSVKDWDPARPGDDRLRNLSNGVKGSSASTVLATMPAIASTGAMLLSGHEAPVGTRP